jgi:hypothetical protein
MPSQRRKPPTRQGNAKLESDSLTGWAEIARFLGQPTAVAQRWARTGMRVSRDGRQVSASPDALTRWVGTENGKIEPIHIASAQEDLGRDLKQALTYVRSHRSFQRKATGERK